MSGHTKEPQEETAWLIEHGGHPAPLYWTGRSWGEWSGDHMQACRFARRHDAQKVALAVGDPSWRPNNHKVVEHMWVGPKVFAPTVGKNPAALGALIEAAEEVERRCADFERINLGGKTPDAKALGTIKNCREIISTALANLRGGAQ